MSVLVKVNVTAPMPQMHRDAAKKFNELRNIVAVGAGFDFLARCGDIFRASNFVSNKDGVATRSWHKTGRAFDYDQDCENLVLVSEIIGGKQFFRTYLKCKQQDGSHGHLKEFRDIRGYRGNAFLFDFTEAAEVIGFKRIPAWNGWRENYNRREFWHYQFDEGLTWDAAMLQLKDKARPADEKVLGLNDRGDDVRQIQDRLNQLDLLSKTEVDGVFGAKTRKAVQQFQQRNGLDADGLVGPATRAKLNS